MTKSTQTGVSQKVSRRSVLSGGTATALAISIFPNKVFAMPFGTANSIDNSLLPQSRAGKTLAKYLCENVHEKIAVKLDNVIADPNIDGERTALALMEARCPGCGERVHPKTSAISAVVPKWQSPNVNATRGVLA